MEREGEKRRDEKMIYALKFSLKIDIKYGKANIDGETKKGALNVTLKTL